MLRSTYPACSPCVTQRRFAAAMVRLTAIRNCAGNMPNGRIGIAIGRTRNRVAGATITAEKPCECDNCFVTHLGIRIGGKHFNEISYQVGDANLSVTTPFTCDSMKSALADERNRIAQRLTKGFRRRIAGVMVQQEETEAPHLRIGVAKRCDLYGGNGNLLGQHRAALLRQRAPSVDEITREFDVRPSHRIQSGLTAQALYQIIPV